MELGTKILQTADKLIELHSYSKVVMSVIEYLNEIGEDPSDQFRYKYLIESMIFHLGRLMIKEKQIEEDYNIEGMGKGTDIYSNLYNEVQNLEMGQEVKNYKQLCAILNQPILPGGDQKKAQIKEFERYFQYVKVGNKFIVTDIYDEPLEKDDKRRLGKNNIYIKLIEVILLHHFLLTGEDVCVMTKKNILKTLGMINEKYKKVDIKYLMSIDSNITKFQINNFYFRAEQRLDQILFRALDNLEKRKLLYYKKETVIVTNEGDRFIANDDDMRLINAVYRSVLDCMGLIHIRQVYLKFKTDQFYEKVNEKLSELYDWQFIYKQYRFIYTPRDIKNDIPRSQIELKKLMLNDQTLKSINDNAITSYDRQTKKWNKYWEIAHEKAKQDYTVFYNVDGGMVDVFDLLSEKTINDMVVDEKGNKVYHYPSYYLEAQKLLADELLSIRLPSNKRLLLPNYNNDDIDDLFSHLLKEA